MGVASAFARGLGILRHRLVFALRRGRALDFASFRFDLDGDLRALFLQLRFNIIGGEPKITDDSPNQSDCSTPPSEEKDPR